MSVTIKSLSMTIQTKVMEQCFLATVFLSGVCVKSHLTQYIVKYSLLMFFVCFVKRMSYTYVVLILNSLGFAMVKSKFSQSQIKP